MQAKLTVAQMSTKMRELSRRQSSSKRKGGSVIGRRRERNMLCSQISSNCGKYCTCFVVSIVEGPRFHYRFMLYPAVCQQVGTCDRK